MPAAREVKAIAPVGLHIDQLLRRRIAGEWQLLESLIVQTSDGSIDVAVERETRLDDEPRFDGAGHAIFRLVELHMRDARSFPIQENLAGNAELGLCARRHSLDLATELQSGSGVIQALQAGFDFILGHSIEVKESGDGRVTRLPGIPDRHSFCGKQPADHETIERSLDQLLLLRRQWTGRTEQERPLFAQL